MESFEERVRGAWRNHRQAKRRAENAAFDALLPAEKRVLIAKDVLAQLAARKLLPRPGVWVESTALKVAYFTPGPIDRNGFDTFPLRKEQAQDKLEECRGCALGGL